MTSQFTLFSNVKIKYTILLLLTFLYACAAASDQTRNAELIVTYNNEEVQRTGSKYKSYSEMRKIADRKEKKYIIFSARWCPSCDFLERAMKQSGHIQSVNLIDVEELWVQGLAKVFKIPGVPTMIVVDERDTVVEKLVGPSDIIMHLLINVKTADEN